MVTPDDDPASEDRRTSPSAIRQGGRRWSDDPDVRSEVERQLVNLSRDLNAMREGHEWSQEDLATAAGVTQQAVLNVEKARADMHISMLVKLAYALGYQVDIRFRRPPQRPAAPYLSRVNPCASAGL